MPSEIYYYIRVQDTLVQVRAVVVPSDGGDPEADRGEGEAGGGAHEAAGDQRGHGGGAEDALPAPAGVAAHREGGQAQQWIVSIICYRA